MKRYKELENLTQTNKRYYLAKYLTKYTDEVVTKFTDNKALVEEIIKDNTIMHMIVTVIDNETTKCQDIERLLNAPFETTFYEKNNYDTSTYIHVLYNLIIK